MEKLRLNDTWVKFPFVPYPAQENFISKLLESLKAGKSALLESPTGTGKTLCLLCGSLAWLDLEKKYQEVPDLRLINESDPTSDNKISLEEMTKSDLKSFKTYRIYFCSRTHSQIRQAIHEFDNTGYQHLRSTVLASRRHLCIHPSAKKAGDNLDNKCRELRKPNYCSNPVPEVIPDIEDSGRQCGKCKAEHTCPFYKNFEKMKEEKTDVLFTMAGAFDQKSLIEKCKKYRVCPFYMSRHLKEHADIIFLPYSYIFNPHILRGLKLDLNNAIVIIDEGHNIERVCEANASFDMTIVDVENCQGELETYSWMLESNEVDDKLLELLPGEKSVRELDKIMFKLRRSLESMEAGTAKTGQFCFTMFSEAGFTKTEWQRQYQNLRDIAQFCAGNKLKIDGLRKMQNVVYNVFFLDADDCGSSQELILEKSFQFFKEKLTPEDEEKKKVPTFSFWCFDAGVIMRFLQKRGVHSFIVTSGTLSPLPPLTRSLGIPFEIELQNDHVIRKPQVLALSIGGVEGVPLRASYINRKNNGETLYPAFGKLVLKVANFSPKGLLIFFTSGEAKLECIESWRNSPYQPGTSLFDAIDKIKPIYQEPKDASKLPGLQNSFSQKIEDPGSNGACMIGVLRGKVSEGLDFKDDLGRAVIIFGVPFLSSDDQNIKHKEIHITRKDGESASNEWYRSEAVRPVNQALGRIIRHQGDYGVVVLADVRYTDAQTSHYRYNVNPDLPGWLKESKQVVSFSQIGSYLGDFFEAIPSKMKDIKIQTELEQEKIREKHKNEMEKEEYSSNSFHALASLIAVEKEKSKTLCSELLNLRHKLEEAGAKTNELRADIAKVKAQLGLKESTNTVDDNSDCESTGDGEWLGDSWE
ncbi:regulator of telomere elongation helicase 1-like 3 [Frankliniella occidentalis]|uniref:Regulator of telomere elongation helicase 1 homolog n=1 Tax=Frankliniella occidentalis TaxID=133901 RepID=A0A6J1RXG7_FRAOC|nr:regulator of telomere elongation helicase 1 homolog [Frankliniella occidentalis]KAE8752829.1 regulator of telomere elongation helicase 1-like 3 [Frankliniella occidentalis]